MTHEPTHLDASGDAHMVDVGDKPVTARRAVAEGRVRISDQLAQAVAHDELAKGNLLAVARLAGIQAAKRTDALIPLCHTLELDSVEVDARLGDRCIELRAEARTTAKTGVEMEALTAVTVAALTVIDMGKAVDPAMVIEHVRLVEKTGGKRGHWRAPDLEPPPEPTALGAQPLDPPIVLAVLTVSDRCAGGEAKDTAGPALAEMAQHRLNAHVHARACVPDEPQHIVDQLERWARHQPTIDLVLTTGGTGLSPRDHTPEATRRVLERPHPGLLELARWRCYGHAPRAALSRGEAGTIGRTLIVNLPGSQRGATETLEALLDVLPHAIDTLRGSGDRMHE